jgi:hypothetical protein
MAFASRFSALRRLLLLSALAASATLVACGGGGGSGAGSAASSSVTGTAATGAPLPGLTVTLKDSVNRSVTATTSVTGAFTLNSTGLTPPFLLLVTTPGGTKLLSVSADAGPTATINVTPLTDLVVRSWYGVQGQSADTAFANPVALPAPSPAQVQSIARTVLNLVQAAATGSTAGLTAPEDLINRQFTANGAGIDLLLDRTRVTAQSTAGATVVLSTGSGTQTSVITFSTATVSITANSTTVSGSNTTTASATDVVPVQTAQVAALDQINATLKSFVQTINARGTLLAAADIDPFIAPQALQSGLTRTQFIANIVQNFKDGQSFNAVVDRVLAIDPAAGTARVVLRFTDTLGGATEISREEFAFALASGSWKLVGNNRIAEIGVQAEGRRDQGNFSSTGASVSIDVRAPVGTVASMSISTTFSLQPVTRGATDVGEAVHRDVFFAGTGPISGTLPAAGTPVAVTLALTGGGTVTYTIPLNAFTTELISITSPTGTTTTTGLKTVTWTLPSTYVVERTKLSVLAFTGNSSGSTGLQCGGDQVLLAPTATSGQVTIPATCTDGNNPPQPVLFANINLSTDGVNGERSQVIYQLSVVGP